MSSNSLYERARRLAGNSALVALSLSAAPGIGQAANLLHDYSAAAEYSNSGFFTGEFDEAAADATTQGTGFKLTGSKTASDTMFWEWNNYYQLTLRKYDVTGFAFVWGGGIDGPLSDGDMLNTAYDFSIDFSHTTPTYSQYDYTGAQWQLVTGLRSDPYSPEQWQSGPDSNSLISSSAWGSMDAAGQQQFAGNLDLTIDEWAATGATSWFVILAVEWFDPLAAPGWEDTHGSMNGDTFTLTIPNQSIDVDLVSSTVVPLPGAVWLLGSGLLGLASIGRRKQS
ncbi:MAG: VPLPA-CTERM sorting domain-containing protein [Gammaproteobacteria bacterium]